MKTRIRCGMTDRNLHNKVLDKPLNRRFKKDVYFFTLPGLSSRNFFQSDFPPAAARGLVI